MKTPRCRYHQHKPMRLVLAETPMFHQHFRNIAQMAVGFHDKRMIYRCPISGCPWVQAYETVSEVTDYDRRCTPHLKERFVEMEF